MQIHILNRIFRTTTALLLIVLLAVMILACSSCGTPSFSPEIQTKLEKVLDDGMKRWNIPGAVVGVWVPGEGEWFVAKGKADVETGEPLKIEDKFRIGSNTKTFTATVVLQLADEGKLSLDDKVEKYVSGIPNGNSITIRQVLNMTSGLWNYTDSEDWRKVFVSEPMKKWKPQELLEIGISHEPYFPPGEGWHYSNTNYTLLGIVIEKLTGNSLGDEIKSRIVDKLGLKNTYLADGPEISGDYSHGYSVEECFIAEGQEPGNTVDKTLIDPSWGWAAGGMISDLEDLKVWAKALATGELISKDTQEERLQWINTGDVMDLEGLEAPFKYGLGITNHSGLLGHDGGDIGYNTSVYYLPSEDATVIVLVNYFDGGAVCATSIDMNLANVVFPGMFQKKDNGS